MPKKFKIITKEVGREKPIETLFTGDVDENYLIKFFGLREPDVEWFKIQRIWPFQKYIPLSAPFSFQKKGNGVLRNCPASHPEE